MNYKEIAKRVNGTIGTHFGLPTIEVVEEIGNLWIQERVVFENSAPTWAEKIVYKGEKQVECKEFGPKGAKKMISKWEDE